MTQMIFVNLPVTDVERSAAFYEAIGFRRDEQFSEAGKAASMQLSDSIVVMLLERSFFATFTTKRIPDARTEVGSLLSISRESRAEVDAITEAALAAGGRELHDPEDHGFMYSRAFEDPDGHGWGPLYMDMDAFAAAQQQAA